eukprot:351534-Chlamydomonas_euryale.AAC.2
MDEAWYPVGADAAGGELPSGAGFQPEAVHEAAAGGAGAAAAAGGAEQPAHRVRRPRSLSDSGSGLAEVHTFVWAQVSVGLSENTCVASLQRPIGSVDL